MSKITLSNVINFENETSAIATLTANNNIIEGAFDNTLSRDGSLPNSMAADLDMDSHRILNLPAAVGGTEPVRLAEINELGIVTGAAALASAVLAAQSSEDDAEAASALAAASASNASTSAATLSGAVSILNGLGTMSTQNASAVAITGGTITGLGAPSLSSDVATKNYVDSVGSTLRVLASVRLATTAVLPNTPVYANGTAGVGATLTAGSNGALSIDSVAVNNTDRVLVKDQAAGLQNGVYTVTDKGSAGTPYILTRAPDADTSAETTNGTFALITAGTVNINTGWIQTTGSLTMGTTALTWAQFSAGGGNTWGISGSNLYSNVSGSVGVGTSSPTFINGGTGIVISKTGGNAEIDLVRADASTAGAASFLAGNAQNELYMTGNRPFLIYTNALERMRIDGSGNVKIGNLSSYGFPVIGTSGQLTQGKVAIVAPGVGGIVGDGIADDQGAIATMIAHASDIWILPGTYRISNNAAWDAGKTYRFSTGAQLTVDSGKTHTILGEVQAPYGQIFAGSGTVTGIRTVYPDWFGAVKDGSTDDQPALQKAVNCAQNASGTLTRSHVILRSGSYGLGTPLTLSPSEDVSLLFEGQGSKIDSTDSTTLIALSGFSGASLIICGGTLGDEAAQFELKNFAMKRASSGVTCDTGLQIGVASSTFAGVHERLVEGIYIQDFVYGIVMQNSTLVHFRRVGVWNKNTSGSKCVYFVNAGGDVGDSDFSECQFVSHNVGAKSSWSGQGVQMNNVVSNGKGIHGIRFKSCIFYYGNVSADLYASSGAGGSISDIWFDNCQFDTINTGINLTATGSGTTIDLVNVSGNYFQGVDGTAVVSAIGVSSGMIYDLILQGNRANGCTVTYCLFARNIRGLISQGNIWGDCTCSNSNTRTEEAESVYTSDVRRLKVGSANTCPVALYIAGAQASCVYDIRGMLRGISSSYTDAASRTNVSILKNPVVDP